jgi:hypothetical protein
MMSSQVNEMPTPNVGNAMDTSTVGFPRESKIWRAWTRMILLLLSDMLNRLHFLRSARDLIFRPCKVTFEQKNTFTTCTGFCSSFSRFFANQVTLFIAMDSSKSNKFNSKRDRILNHPLHSLLMDQLEDPSKNEFTTFLEEFQLSENIAFLQEVLFDSDLLLVFFGME